MIIKTDKRNGIIAAKLASTAEAERMYMRDHLILRDTIYYFFKVNEKR